MGPFVEQVAADAGALGLSVVALLGIVAGGEGLRRAGVSAATTRHVVHGGVGLFVASIPLFFAHPAGAYLLAAVFAGVNYLAWRSGRWAGIHGTGRDSWGTVAFPLALIPALWICWTLDETRIYALQTAFLVLAVADPLAAWVGRRRALGASTARARLHYRPRQSMLNSRAR